VVKFTLRSLMNDPFHPEEVDIGVDLRETGMIDFESSNFSADLLESRSAISDVKSIYVAKEETCVRRRVRLNGVASR
jgi:hypothetical protein